MAEHEYAIFFGDLNYRIDLDGDRVRQMALNGALGGLNSSPTPNPRPYPYPYP